MPPVGFEHTISAGERPQAYTLDRAATGIGRTDCSGSNITGAVPVHRWGWRVIGQVSLLLSGQLIFCARFETGVFEMICPVLLSLAQGTHRLCFMWDDSTHVSRSRAMFSNHSVNNAVTTHKQHKLKHTHASFWSKYILFIQLKEIMWSWSKLFCLAWNANFTSKHKYFVI